MRGGSFGFQLIAEVVGIYLAQGHPTNKTFDPKPKPFMAKLQGEDRGQRGTGGFARLPPDYAPVPVEIRNSLRT